MLLWLEWWKVVVLLRNACSRTQNFMWLIVSLVGISVRPDLLGVSSIMRALGLVNNCYDPRWPLENRPLVARSKPASDRMIFITMPFYFLQALL